MCGRFTLTSVDDVVAELGGVAAPASLAPSYNIAPTQPVAILANDHRAGLVMARWGLVPSWADDLAVGIRMINARRETVGQKPAFRDALASRRCLVVADGFYEWQRAGRSRIPYYVRRVDHRLMAFAGLWEPRHRLDPDGLRSCTIITGPANPLVAPIHDRMPVLIGAADFDRWLTPGPVVASALADLLVPPPADGLECYRVSSRVNSAVHDDPACIARFEPVQTSLF